MSKIVYDIFISYRREGGGATAGRINDMLTADGYSVSYDVDTLREGRFDMQLLERIEQCQDFILVVDRNCFVRTIDPATDSQEDWLWQELKYAIQLKKNVIPVLLAGAKFPKKLPEDIDNVRFCNGPQCVHEYFDSFYNKLKEMLRAFPRLVKPSNTGQTLPTKNEAYLKLKADMDCIFYLDGEERSHLKAGFIQKIPLTKGEYELMFVSEENDADRLEMDFVMPDVDKLQKVNLSEIRNVRLQRESGAQRIDEEKQAEEKRKAEEKRLTEGRKHFEEWKQTLTLYDVVLINAGAAKLQVVKSVMEACGIGLKEAKDLVDRTPSTLKGRLPFEQANRLKNFISASGATLELRTFGQQATVKTNLEDTYDVVLINAGGAKLQVVKTVMEACGLGLKEAKDLVDGAPTAIRKGLSLAKAKSLKEMIEVFGARLIITLSE